MPGRWQRYYTRWKDATLERLDPQWLELVEPLRKLVPPAVVIDKSRYSAFKGSALHNHLQSRGADTLIITGSETDVCVLATVLDGVDLGYRVGVVGSAEIKGKTVVNRGRRDRSVSFGHDKLMQVETTSPAA